MSRTESPEEIAEKLLIPLWRCVPKAYKMKYARNIWDQFSDQIKNAASTSDTGRFLDAFCKRMQCSLLTEDVPTTAAFLRATEPRKLLKCLREETTYLVMLVRVANEQRKEDWKKELEGREDGNDSL